MEQREQIYQSIETKCITLTEKYNTLIIKEIEQKYNITLNLDPDSEPIIDLLFTPLRDDVIELLHKYNSQNPELIFSLLSNLCTHNNYDNGMYIYLLSRFTKLKNYNKKDTIHTLSTDLGTLRFQKFTEAIEDKQVIELVTSGKCANKCHTMIGVFHELLYDCDIVTSLLPGRYGGNYFHSYFITPQDTVVDISNNGVFSKEGYYSYFKPQEIISYPATELLSRYEQIKEKNEDAKSLQIALEHMKSR